MSEFPAHNGVDIQAAVGVADGSLQGDARARAKAQLEATPPGRRALEQQQRVVRALRAAGPAAPPGLRAAIEARHPHPSRTRLPSFPRSALVVGAVAALVAFVVVLASGVGHQPTVAAALELGRRPPTAPPPRPLTDRPTLLARDVDGVVFPNWALARQIAPPGLPHTGWKPVGARHDQLAGRRADTVFYQHMNHRVAYTIIAGHALDPPTHARRITVAGHQLWQLRDAHRQAIVFTRQGHTCLLAGNVITSRTLQRLATWPGAGHVHF